ncbi:hypothetical protein GTQ40_17605 [Flavobacteriaceae bacterium R38]|nr:hypothetical protein [Flavobacteriaceae bacterium R38]
MKTNMEEIDKLIKDTLTQEEAKFYDELEEKNVLRMVADIFKGKNSWLVIIMNIVNLIVFGLFIYCLIQVFNTDVTNELIKWIAAGFICLNITGMIKLYMWMQVDKNTILREIKRIELLVSSVSNKI